MIALHEYDYLNNNYIENDEGDEEDLNLLGYDINNIIGNSSTVDNTNFSSNITENSVTVSNIIGNSFTIDNTNFSKENCDKYNLQRGIFQNTHQYVTGELNGIINNSNYKYLDKLKSKVYSLLIDLNRIQAETVSDNISDNYKKYSYVINNFRNTSFKQYINIPEIGSTIDNIINIVNSREEYMNSKLNESLIVRTNH